MDLKQTALSNDDKWQTPDTGDTPNQPRNLSFPKSLIGGRKRSFQPSWFDRWTWLHYVTSLDSAFCFVCIKSFINGTLTCSKKETSFLSRGFKNWKKAFECFSQHEKSDCHQEAIDRKFKLKTEVKDVGELLLSQHKETKSKNRQNFIKIIDAIQYLARQGIPLRGDDEEKDSNLCQLLAFKTKNDPELKEWLQRKTNKYVAPVLQNELLQVMSNLVLREMLTEIKSVDFYSIMVDETSDSSNAEQLVICLRWVDNNLETHEDFLDLYSLSDLRADTMTNAIKDVFLRFDLPFSKLRGQYCNAMAGKKSGVATQIRKLEPRALYTHCYGHALNLACKDSIKHCKLIKDTLDIATEITDLIKESPRRQAMFHRIKSSKDLEKVHQASEFFVQLNGP